MNLRKIGLRLIMISIVFGTIETHYFGYNFTAQSTGEIVCDIITMLLTFFGIILILSNFKPDAI